MSSMLSLVSCVNKPSLVSVDPKEEQILELMDRLDAQNQALEDLKFEMERMKPPVPLPANSKKVAKLPNIPSVPIKKLAPKPTEEDEEDLDVDREEGLSIADSSHEAMHWYYAGLKEMGEKKFEKSNAQFQRFLKDYPNHVYADRASYWVAKNNFANQEYSLAIIETNRLESRFPESVRVPDSMLTRAEAFIALKQTKPAEEILRDILGRYPGSSQAETASRKLAALDMKPLSDQKAPVLLDQSTI